MLSKSVIRNKKLLLSGCLILILGICSCAYYNTLFNALKSYDAGNKKIETSKDGQITAEIRKDFYAAIDKCWKLINLYSDSSKYADDALVLISKSHYQVEEYSKSEMYLTQFISRYPRSAFGPEARLWLAKSLIKLGKADQASEYLNTIIAEGHQDDITAQACFYLGELFLQQKNYEPALNNFRNCIRISHDDDLSARAQLTIADIYFEEKDYQAAIDNYDQVSDFSGPIKVDFDAQVKKVSTLILMGEYTEAGDVLIELLNQSRFVDYYPFFQARMGECYALRKKFDQAADKFQYVLQKHPRTEGAGIAAFGLAQLQETYFNNPDSARKLYLRVGQEDKNSNYKSRADQRAQLLQAYVKIKENIQKDLADLNTTNPGDSAVVQLVEDSTMVEGDSLIESGRPKPEKEKKKTEPPKAKRSLGQIKVSLEKNRFALAEFFLLNMQYYDSAEVAYTHFIENTTDSILYAQAYYALYYIEEYGKQDTVAGSQYEKIILDKFPSSVYAEYIQEKSGEKKPEQTETTDSIKIQYLQAESFLFENKYDDAILLFDQIAVQDSGSAWAEKARYAVAWIYENKLQDIPRAVEAYTVMIREYPNSKMIQMAKNKIKLPEETVENKTDTKPDSSASLDQNREVVQPPDSTQGIPEESPPDKNMYR